jgi:hypothetical protein
MHQYEGQQQATGCTSNWLTSGLQLQRLHCVLLLYYGCWQRQAVCQAVLTLASLVNGSC